MRVAYDMSSVMWMSLSVGKDKEFGYEVPDPVKADRKVWINTAKYGYENAVNHMTAVLRQFDLAPIDMILVFEGMHSKAPRRRIEASYKEDDPRAPEAYQEFEKLKALMQDTWLSLGATAVQQDYVEGDDVLAYLARETEADLVIATGDRDLTVLNGQNRHGARIQVRCGDHKVGVNPYGPWDLRLIPVHKALVGDSGDKIKGVVGFGPQKFNDMLIAYGEEGLFQIQDLLEKTGRLGDLHTQVDDDKLIKMICEQEAQCYRSYLLGKLHPEWVNTIINPLQFKAGMVKRPPQPDERLTHWAASSWLVTAATLSLAMDTLRRYVPESPFVTFDIETSTPDESDHWLEQQSKADEDGDLGVDPYGSTLTGFSLTFGKNCQYTLYFSVDHADTANISLEQARVAIEACRGKRLVIQNFSFEATVCYATFAEHWLDNGYNGFLPDMDDTKFMFSYVDENNSLGLKKRSKEVLGYEQESFEAVTIIKGPVPRDSYAQGWQSGGRVLRAYEAPDTQGQMVDGEMQYALVPWEDRRYKMNELPATHVFGYGCDDTICTAAHYVYCRLIMELEHTWQIYREVEIDAAYQHAVNFECGITISVEKINELSKLDDKTYDEAWGVLRQYLIEQRYEGSICPEFAAPLEPADVKMAFEIWTGRKLDTMVRTPAKLVAFITAAEEPTFALMIAALYKAEKTDNEGHAYAWFNSELAKKFKGEPVNPIGSPKKLGALLYEAMKLPIRVRNKATDNMRNAGIFEGNPKTDVLAIEYALQMDATPEQKAVLEAMKLMGMVRTRRSLYYTKYANFQHWKDGLVRPQHNQCAANTRRATTARPNTTQLPKHTKIESQPSRFREVVIPHKRTALVVSMDFEAQELKIIAHYSQDGNLVACYVGDNLKDMHSLTGLGIFVYKSKKRGVQEITYEEFAAIREANDKSHPLNQYVKEDRNLGKKTNFTTEFGAMAPKVAQTLLVSEVDAQAFIDAREAMFPGVKTWKEGVVADAKDVGYVKSMMGAVRHLRPMFNSGNSYEASKAERQAVNFMVQGSAAEQTKLAEGRMWKDGLFLDFDAACYGPIHDEVVASVLTEDLYAFIPRMHACMVGHFANMSIPITSSISFGDDFYNQIEIGNAPTLEAIQQGLVDLEKLREDQRAKRLKEYA